MKNSRRSFIKNLGGVAAGISFLPFVARSNTAVENIEKQAAFPDKNLEQSSKRILITYESQFGSTEEIARFIGENIPTKKNIDIVAIQEIKDLKRYNMIIIGSAIQYDHWMPETRNFVINNRNDLKAIDVVGFFSCLTLSKNTAEAKQKAENYAKKIRNIAPEINLEEVGQFAGVLDYSKMQFTTRIVAKAIMGIMGVQEGDYRDWELISNWCRSLEM